TIALLASSPGAPRICLLELPATRIGCATTERMLNARPAFSADDKSVYYPGVRGVGRVRVDSTGDELVAPEAQAPGGLAVAPDGAHLVYSACGESGPLVEVGPGETPRDLVGVGHHGDPGAGPGDRVAYVSLVPGGRGLMLREPDGITRQLVGPLAKRISQP